MLGIQTVLIIISSTGKLFRKLIIYLKRSLSTFIVGNEVFHGIDKCCYYKV